MRFRNVERGRRVERRWRFGGLKFLWPIRTAAASAAASPSPLLWLMLLLFLFQFQLLLMLPTHVLSAPSGLAD